MSIWDELDAASKALEEACATSAAAVELVTRDIAEVDGIEACLAIMRRIDDVSGLLRARGQRAAAIATEARADLLATLRRLHESGALTAAGYSSILALIDATDER